MRLEELAYDIDGRPVTLSLRGQITVVGGLNGPERRGWVDRTLGVLHGLPPGAGVRVILQDGAGNRVRLVRDRLCDATVTDPRTGEELPAHFALWDRLDWLALLGLDHQAARDLIVLGPHAFEAGTPDNTTESRGQELTDARQLLAAVETEYQAVLAGYSRVEELWDRTAELDEQIRNFDQELARCRHGQAARAVRRLDSELALLQGAKSSERLTAEATLAAAEAAADWRRATQALDQALAAFGDRRRLDPRALAHALTQPSEVPVNLDALHRAYLDAGKRRAAVVARLNEGTAAELPVPSAPWVLRLARIDHPELWARAERLRAARTRAAELSMGLGAAGGHHDLVQEIEEVHAAVEKAERAIASAKLPLLAIPARRRLARAEDQEEVVLAKAGFGSWLTFQMRRIDVLLEPDALEAFRVAELEAQLAAAAWSELAGEVDADAALAAFEEIEGYAAQMAAAQDSLDSTEVLRRELADEVEPAYADAYAALLEVCRPFDVEPEHATSEVSAIVSEARHARLQAALEEAESVHRAAESRLEMLLADAGLSGPGGLASRAAAVTARVAEAMVALEKPETTRSIEEVAHDLEQATAELAWFSRPDWDARPLVADDPLPDTQTLQEERARAVEEAAELEDSLPDLGRLEDRRQALQRRVAVLGSSSGEHSRRLSFEDAEMALLGRFAQARRVGPEAEPVPVIVDDALAEFSRPDKWRLLDLLARLAEGSQVVYLTDDPEVCEWASTKAGTASVASVVCVA